MGDEANKINSILLSIKKMLGLPSEYTNFDTDIIIHINTAFSSLNQLGIGPEDGYSITDDKQQWSDYIKDTKKIESIKTYIYLKVKIVFDPPSSSAILEVFKESLKELEWRLSVEADNMNKTK